jgi:hypothetical protein
MACAKAPLIYPDSVEYDFVFNYSIGLRNMSYCFGFILYDAFESQNVAVGLMKPRPVS